MPEKSRYPQIPSTVWWGVRAILQRSPNAPVDDRTLSAQLNVQSVAAKQYITELQTVGILNEDYRATELALRWRLDNTYEQAMEEIVATIYPESLRSIAPSSADRQKAVSWFMHDGLGEGAAKNKAGTYFLLSTKDPSESPTRGTSAKTNSSAAQKRSNGDSQSKTIPPKANVSYSRRENKTNGDGSSGMIPLNVNVQIHISADANTEQIEAIFSSMKRYLYDQQTS